VHNGAAQGLGEGALYHPCTSQPKGQKSCPSHHPAATHHPRHALLLHVLAKLGQQQDQAGLHALPPLLLRRGRQLCCWPVQGQGGGARVGFGGQGGEQGQEGLGGRPWGARVGVPLRGAWGGAVPGVGDERQVMAPMSASSRLHLYRQASSTGFLPHPPGRPPPPQPRLRAVRRAVAAA